MTKQIGSYSFRHICTLESQRGTDGTLSQVAPQSAYKNESNHPLHAYGEGPFCKFTIPKNVREAGVYLLTVGTEIKYIGECMNLSSRYNAGYGNISPRNCYNGGQPTNCRINNLIYKTIKEGKQVELWFLATSAYKSVESSLIKQLDPVWNIQGTTR